MWRSLWSSIDHFSLHHFKYLINTLREFKVVDEQNKELVADILQSIAEIVAYGDRRDPSIFECFMEYQVLAEFVRVLKISRNSGIESPLLQYLSIMIQNIESDHAVYYFFSNDYINNVISHQFEFNAGDLALYYVSFLRTVSCRINRDTIWLLVKVNEGIVVSFPLYSEAIKFAHHGEKMIQAAIRALTLNIYRIRDDTIYQFFTTRPASKYFLLLIQSFKEKCFHLDSLIHAPGACPDEKRKQLLVESDKILDDLFYLKDIVSLGESCLSKLVTQILLRLLVFPMLFPLLELSHDSGKELSIVTSLYVICCVLQIVGGKDLLNPVASVILYPRITSDRSDVSSEDATDIVVQPDLYLHGIEEMGYMEFLSEEANDMKCNYLHGRLSKSKICILSYLFSDDPGLVLAFLMLLVVFTECKDLDYLVAPCLGLLQKDVGIQKSMGKQGCIIADHMPQILHALLKILASRPPFLVQLHTGWFLRWLLGSQGKSLSDHGVLLFNTSFQQSCKHLWKELDGCWFDHIPCILMQEWESCESALVDSPQSKDPFFMLELAFHKEIFDGEMTSFDAWKRMLNAVKVFILHIQLKAFLFSEDPLKNPCANLGFSSAAILSEACASDPSNATFESKVPLASGVPCQIAFSQAGIKDIFVLPVAKEISGKLLLVEEYSHDCRQGIVFAVAALAASSPKIDENHPTWLHIRVRELDPVSASSKAGSFHRTGVDGRWTLGFRDPEACKAAQLLILEEIRKQRCCVERLLVSLFQDDSANSTPSMDE